MSSLRSRPALAIGLAFALVAAGCGSSGASPAASAASAAAGDVTVASAMSTTLGAFLVGPNGLALYTKSTDTANTSTCTGTCIANWPALTLTAGQKAVAGAGVTGTFASFSRTDGTIQVTYNGLPLYYWVKDTKPGDTTGQGVGGFVVAAAAGSGTPGGGTPSATPAGYNY